MADLLMYDAVDVAAIPAHAQMVAGYVDGGYRTWHELVQSKQRIRADPGHQGITVFTFPDPHAILLHRKSLRDHQTGNEVFRSNDVDNEPHIVARSSCDFDVRHAGQLGGETGSDI